MCLAATSITSIETLFHYPGLLLLAVAAGLVLWRHLSASRGAAVRFSSLRVLKMLAATWTLKSRSVLVLLRMAAIALVACGLARPQWGKEETKFTTLGIDIMLAVDVSGSMRAADFEIRGKRANRLAAAKQAVRRFIGQRSNDRIGLVVFARRAYVQCPLTLDYAILLDFLGRVEIVSDRSEDGTAIGAALGTCVARLADVQKGQGDGGKAKGKVVVLLTDGRNNVSHPLKPEQAVEIAKTMGVRVYTIGAGTKGRAPMPARDWFGNTTYVWQQVDIDDEGLTRIAKECGGEYFRATDTDSLTRIYRQIDRLERTEKEVTKYAEYDELFAWFCLPALGLLLLEIVLANTVFRKIP